MLRYVERVSRPHRAEERKARKVELRTGESNLNK